MEQRLHKSLRLAATLLVALSASSAGAFSGSIDLTFAGRGESSTVNKVIVTNISKPASAPVTLNGTDILRLVDPDDPDAIESTEELQVISEPILTPNPSFGDGTLIFDAKSDGPVRVSVYTTGGMLLDAATLNVSKGRNTARIPAQATGIYIVNIDGQGVKSSTRWICSGSKSFSGIALGGAAQWADTALPTRTVAKAPQTRADANNVKVMDYTPGDILRFEGTCGKMRSMLHLSPESSHDIMFDFFKCEDKNGYNYPIVRIGDMLWMMEDLRPQTMTNLVKTSKANNWKNISDADAAEFVMGEKAFFNQKGGALALPEGWRMPSLDEMYALIEEMNADTLRWGDFLKDRDGYEWEKPLLEGLDSIHLQLQPNGYINPNGELTDEDFVGAWATRNTLRHGYPVSFEINALNTQLYPKVIHEKGCGFTVRGCRLAPSVYTEMLNQAFGAVSAEAREQRRVPMQVINTNGPLGTYYTYGSDRSSIFFDFSYCDIIKGGATPRSGVLYKPKDLSSWYGENKEFVPKDINGANFLRHLRKVTAQSNADGYQNVVYATWSKPYRVIGGKTDFIGDGTVNLTIFGDSAHNHAMLDDYTSRPLLNKDGSEYIWNIPDLDKKYWWGWRLVAPTFPPMTYMSDFRTQYYERAYNLKCIQDQTGDGVDEIVMNVGDKIAIFDGATLRCLRERTIAGTGTLVGRANMRFDVADVNGDGNQDIIVLANTDYFTGMVYLYDKGHIDEEPVWTKVISNSCFFCDIKVGYMSNSNLPEIAILSRGHVSKSDVNITKEGYLYVSRLEYDQNDKLQERVILDAYKVNCFYSNDVYRGLTGNLNLVFGYFRGRSYTQDLIVGDGLWRWDETNAKPTYRFQILPETKDNIYAVAADAIVAVPTAADGKESILYFKDYYISLNYDKEIPYTSSTLTEVWLNGKDFTTVNSKGDFGTAFFKWPADASYTRCTNFTKNNEENANPVLCKFADREQAKRFKYISHELTFSEPRIYAVIAAAPYYKGLPGIDRAQTTWGKTKSDGTSTARSDTWGGSVIAGYEHSYSAPFLSSMNAGVEFTTKISVSGSIASDHTETISYGQTYAAGLDHVVVMQATPFDTYHYEIVGSSEPDEEGMEFVVSMPRTRAFVGLKLEDYVRLMSSQKNVAKPQRFLTSTPGDPWSYPENYDNEIKFEDDAHPFLKCKDPNLGYTNELVGTAASTSRSISLATSDSKTKSVSLDVETELVGTLMGIKAGVGFNYGHTKEWTHTFGEELTVEGTVPGLPSLGDKKHPQFRWNMVWYYVKDAGGVYPVINYIVTRP